MPLGLFPRETDDALSLMPGEADTSAPPAPAWYAGIPSAIGLGIEHGATAGVMAIMPAGDQAVRGMNLPASAYEVHEIDPEEYQRNLARDEAEVLASMKPNPRLVGTAGQVLHGLASGLTRIVPGAAVGGPLGGAIAVGGSEGLATRNELETAGVDTNTANALGAGSALFAGAGALLPGGFGMTLTQRIATGAAAQTEMGIVNRAMMSSVLDQAGYTEQARAYVPFDGMAMMADAVLGAGFGAAHHVFAPSTVDAARVVKDAEHVERAPPGIPTDGASRQAALDAVDAHVEALIRGDDTPPPTGDVRYVPDAAQERARTAALRDIKEAAIELPKEFYPGGLHSAVETTPIPSTSESLFRETDMRGVMDLLTQNDEGGALRTFVTDDRDLAIGQSGKGVVAELVTRLVSGKEHIKPATGIIGGKEFSTDYIAKNAIRAIHIKDGRAFDSIDESDITSRSSNAKAALLKRFPEVFKNEDGSVTLTTKTAAKDVEFANTLDPDVREALDQAQAVLRDNPDLKVAGEGDEAVNAADALRRAVDEVRQSAGDEELHRVAAACFGRA